jgi:hypothetical protein
MVGVSFSLFRAGKITAPLSSDSTSGYLSPERSLKLEAEEEEDLEMEVLSHGSDEALLNEREVGSSDTARVTGTVSPRAIMTEAEEDRDRNSRSQSSRNQNRSTEEEGDLEFSPMHQTKS